MGKSKGFSLVELIIVIAIIAIISAAVAPALIRYIVKARKADDIAAAQTIGTSINAAITSEEHLYDYVAWSVSEMRKGNPVNNAYRILGYSSVDQTAQGRPHNALFRTVNIGGSRANMANEFADFMNADLGGTFVKMRFGAFSKIDQWIVCVDRNEHLSVWVGADLNGNQYHINENHKIGSKEYYMLWPEVDKSYNLLQNANSLPN